MELMVSLPISRLIICQELEALSYSCFCSGDTFYCRVVIDVDPDVELVIVDVEPNVELY